MPDVAFLIIGAQKGGTTSLYEYMQRHPQIHMPPGKEIAFFNRDATFRRGWEWYRTRVTQGASPTAICGEASTYYMCGCPGDILDNEPKPPLATFRNAESLEEVIPQRIKRFLPDVRLVCVLRDPVDRAFSAYRMMLLERAESRSFDAAIDQLMAPSELNYARAVPTLTNGYVVMGEYRRVLGGFLRSFSPEQLMVVFTGELAEAPAETLRAVFSFVGVDADFVPENLNTRYRAAAVKERIPGLHLAAWQTRLTRIGVARALWHGLPERLRTVIDGASYRAKAWNARRGEVGDDMSRATRERLREHFWLDSEGLSTLLGRDIPWLATWERSSAGLEEI